MELEEMITNVKIHIHSISYIITLTMIKHKEVNEEYSMLMRRPQLIDAKVNSNHSNSLVTIRNNRTVKTVLMNQRKEPRPKLPKVSVYYNFAEGLTNKKKELWLATKQDVLAIWTMTLPKIKGNQESVKRVEQPYLDHFYTFTEDDIEVDETHAPMNVENLKVVALILRKLE